MHGLRTRRRLTQRPLGRLEVLEGRLLMAFNPTGAEQEMLEHVNRMRMDPQGELDVLFSSLAPLVACDSDANTNIQYFHDPTAEEIAAEWPALTAAAPLAWNETLYNIASAHNAAMIAADMQTHQTPGEPEFATRFTDAGYTTYSWIAENVFAFAHSTFEAHSGFAIDWAVSGRGHRTNLMNASIREAGISVTAESNGDTSVGPLLVTEDFGNRYDLGNPYLLGVAYQDGDSDGRYTAGEGLAGVSITVSGAAGTFTTTTMSAGGYQLHVPAGTYTVTASGGSLSASIVHTGVTLGDANVKLDFLPSIARPTTCGVYDPTTSRFFLRCSNNEGPIDLEFGFGAPGWKPLSGDWNGDGRDTIGLFQPAAAQFYLRNANSGGPADVSFGYGDPSQGAQYILVMGDWNGDGVDTVGLFHKPSAAWFLRNTNSQGNADLTFGFGVPGSNWMPVVGDWNGDGIDTIGLYDPATGMFYLRNSQTTGMSDIAFPYGAAGAGWTPLIGDWDGDGVESAGFYQPGAASHFYLRNDFSAGMADVHFGLGFAGVEPIVGNWLGAAGQTLLAESGSAATPSLISSPQSLLLLVDAAIARWAAAGATDAQLARMRQAEVTLADLPGRQLGEALDGRVILDRDAAGHGWFLDSTPGDDREYLAGDGAWQAIDARAADRIDLLTVIEHELGHVAGLPDLAVANSLMSGQLAVGVRRLPG